jgi:hypothetical protein
MHEEEICIKKKEESGTNSLDVIDEIELQANGKKEQIETKPYN